MFWYIGNKLQQSMHQNNTVDSALECESTVEQVFSSQYVKNRHSMLKKQQILPQSQKAFLVLWQTGLKTFIIPKISKFELCKIKMSLYLKTANILYLI